MLNSHVMINAISFEIFVQWLLVGNNLRKTHHITMVKSVAPPTLLHI